MPIDNYCLFSFLSTVDVFYHILRDSSLKFKHWHKHTSTSYARCTRWIDFRLGHPAEIHASTPSSIQMRDLTSRVDRPDSTHVLRAPAMSARACETMYVCVRESDGDGVCVCVSVRADFIFDSLCISYHCVLTLTTTTTTTTSTSADDARMSFNLCFLRCVDCTLQHRRLVIATWLNRELFIFVIIVLPYDIRAVHTCIRCKSRSLRTIEFSVNSQQNFYANFFFECELFILKIWKIRRFEKALMTNINKMKMKINVMWRKTETFKWENWTSKKKIMQFLRISSAKKLI